MLTVYTARLPVRAELVRTGETRWRSPRQYSALKAEKQVAKELDVKPMDIDKAIKEAKGEVG